MSRTSSSEGYLGARKEWEQRIAAGKPDWLTAFDSSDCLVEYWVVRNPDTQAPHDRDEVYVITSGNADFDMNGQVRPVAAGDLLFVPAGMSHRFVRTSPDLAMWIVFFGPRRKDILKKP